MLAIVIIPARYQSTRFPGKPLARILDKPMIQHVYERVVCAKGIDKVYVATDDLRIYETVKVFSDNVLMTSNKHETGTDRIAEAVNIIGNLCYDDIIINVQGDEPVVSPLMIEILLDTMKQGTHHMATIARQIDSKDEIENTNVVKVVFDKDYNALYFSRCPIPYNRKEGFYYKHIGLYAYKKSFLVKFTELPKGRLEQTECLEQLRALENGYKIRVAITNEDTIGVDTPNDIERVEKWIRNSSL